MEINEMTEKLLSDRLDAIKDLYPWIKELDYSREDLVSFYIENYNDRRKENIQENYKRWEKEGLILMPKNADAVSVDRFDGGDFLYQQNPQFWEQNKDLLNECARATASAQEYFVQSRNIPYITVWDRDYFKEALSAVGGSSPYSYEEKALNLFQFLTLSPKYVKEYAGRLNEFPLAQPTLLRWSPYPDTCVAILNAKKAFGDSEKNREDFDKVMFDLNMYRIGLNPLSPFLTFEERTQAIIDLLRKNVSRYRFCFDFGDCDGTTKEDGFLLKRMEDTYGVGGSIMASLTRQECKELLNRAEAANPEQKEASGKTAGSYVYAGYNATEAVKKIMKEIRKGE
jgi:hypothetical protein